MFRLFARVETPALLAVTIPPWYSLILHGADTYSSRKRLIVLREGFKKKYDPAGSNVSSFTVPFEIAKVRASAAQVGMFAKKRLVVLYDFYSTANAADREQFNAWLEAGAFPDTIMILWEGKDLGKPASPHASRGARSAEEGCSEEASQSQSEKIHSSTGKDFVASAR